VSLKRVVDFNALPRESRERFVAAASGEGTPKPLFEDTDSAVASSLGNIFLIALGLGLVFWVGKAGFGESIDGPAYIALYAIGAILAIGGLSGLVRALATAKRMPYAEGTYLFPVDLVQAKGSQLTISPLSEVTTINGVHHHQDNSYQHTELRLMFNHGAVEVLTIHDQAEAEQVLASLNHAQATTAAAVEAGTLEVFEDLDPFYGARNGGQWDLYCASKDAKPSDGPIAKSLPKAFQWIWVVALVVGGVGGAGAWQARNNGSDDALFQSARGSGVTWELEGYLYSGATRHVDEVRDVLLPKAEFEEAKAVGSVTALREFLELHPGSVHEGDARDAIHLLFESALADFERKAEGANEAVLPLMRAMFTWLEAAESPPVEVRFRPPDPSLLHDVDELVTTLPSDETGGVPLAPVSPSFDDARSRAREEWITTELENGFRQVIPADILDLNTGEHLDPSVDLSSDPPTSPTIAVSYTVDASGSIYTNEENTQGYVGIQIYFVVSMLVPGTNGEPGPEPLTFMLDVEPPSEFSVDTGGIAIEPSDYLVYDVMAKKAFENLASSLGAALFADGDMAGLEIVSGEIPELPGLELGGDDEDEGADDEGADDELPE